MQESFAKRCFSLIDEYAPGFSSSILGYDMLTPPDLEREIGLTGIVTLLMSNVRSFVFLGVHFVVLTSMSDA